MTHVISQPLPDTAKEILVYYSRIITALRPGARDIQFIDIGYVRMHFFGLYRLWQATPWSLLSFTYKIEKKIWTDTSEHPAEEIIGLAPVYEHVVYVKYVGFCLITPDDSLVFADTIEKLHEVHDVHYG